MGHEILGADLKTALGPNLVSVVLYGSALEGRGSPDLLVVLKEAGLDVIASASEVLRKHKARAAFYTAPELKGSLDVFPVEFKDILAGYRVLAGEDPLEERRVGEGNMRHQLEFELRSKLLRLRAAWPGLKGNARALQSWLGPVGASLTHLLRHARRLAPSIPQTLAEPFERARALRGGEKASLEELERLYAEVHRSLERVVAGVDGHI